MSADLTGRVALVTGAGGDIGRSVALGLVRRGARVYAADIRPVDPADGLVPLLLDVRDSDAVAVAFARIAEESGPVRLLVNAAGGPGSIRTPIDQVTDEAWHAVVSLNLDGTFHCCREAVRWMKSARTTGSIVNVSSGAGRTSSRTGVQAYAAAKAGVIGFTRQLAREAGPAGIRVNCVAPGLIAVDALQEEIAALGADGLAAHLGGVALGRLGRADDLVEPVLFFLGDGAGFVTGQTISVDGGSVMLG